MAEFDDKFAESHTAEIISLLDRSQELELFRAPDIIVDGNPAYGPIAVTMNGETKTQGEFELQDDEELIEAEIRTLGTFGRLAPIAMQKLNDGEIKAATPPESVDGTIDYAAFVSAIETQSLWYLQEASYTQNTFTHFDAAIQQQVTIEVGTITSHTSNVKARQVQVTTSDGILVTQLTASELPVSFKGATTYRIEKQVRPFLEDDMVTFGELLRRNDIELVAILKIIYASAEANDSNADSHIQAILNTYADADEKATLARTFANIQHDARESYTPETAIHHPELDLPSANEIKEFQAIIERAQSI